MVPRPAASCGRRRQTGRWLTCRCCGPKSSRAVPVLGRRQDWSRVDGQRHAASAAGERLMELTEDDVLEILKLFEQSKFDFLQLEQGERKITVSKGGYVPPGAAAPPSLPTVS